MTQSTQSQQTTPRGRHVLAHKVTPWAIDNGRAGTGAMAFCAFALCPDCGVEILRRAIAMEGNR